MQTHLSTARSCKWYMKGKFREWGLPDLVQEEHPVQVPDIDIQYDPEEDDDLHYDDGGGLGPSDFQFIPRDQEPIPVLLGDQGPGPQAAAHRIERQVRHFVLDDDDDERVTDIHPTAGHIRKKEQPPSFRAVDKDGDVDMENRYHPFVSELDWKVAQWAIKDNPGQNALDRLLAVPGVQCFFSLLISLLISQFLGCRKIRSVLPQCARPSPKGRWHS